MENRLQIASGTRKTIPTTTHRASPLPQRSRLPKKCNMRILQHLRINQRGAPMTLMRAKQVAGKLREGVDVCQNGSTGGNVARYKVIIDETRKAFGEQLSVLMRMGKSFMQALSSLKCDSSKFPKF